MPPTYDPATQCIVERAWLESLLKLAEKAEKVSQVSGTSYTLVQLFGFISSAKTILKYK